MSRRPEPTQDAAAWESATLRDPHAVPDKADRVRRMFAAIAESYDLNNRVHSLWRDQAWRRAAVAMSHVRSVDTVLDVACGTGDLSIAYANAGAKHVIGLDFTHEMLQVAEHKAAHAGAKVLRSSGSSRLPIYADGDALRLPIADRSVDIVSIAFGIRNVADPARAIAEFHRVLKPGGRVMILEFSLPANPLLRLGYNLYFKHIMPRTATLLSRDKTGAYRYLPQSVNTFIDRPRMVAMLAEAGFKNVALRPLTFGIAVAYLGYR